MEHGPECLCETPGCMGSTPEGRAAIRRMVMEEARAALGWPSTGAVKADTELHCRNARALAEDGRPEIHAALVRRGLCACCDAIATGG